jgi:hypothetical protein
MNPEQALQIVENVRQQIQLAGKDHDALRQAVQTLANALAELAELKKPKTAP